MSLLENAMTMFYRMTPTRTSDGEGGTTTTWANGASILAAVVPKSMPQIILGEKQVLGRQYAVTAPRGTALLFHEVIKRASDSRVFRITSASADLATPINAGLAYEQSTAEDWSLA